MAANSVETHPQKDAIIKRIIDGHSLRGVAEGLVPPVSVMALHRYKSNVINPMLRRAEVETRVLIGEPTIKHALVPPCTSAEAVQVVQTALKDAPVLSIFRQRLEALHSRIDRTLTKAEDAVRVVADRDTGELVAVGADLAVISPLINQAHKNLEMLGRATGELEHVGGSGGVSIQVVCPVAPAIEAMPRINYASDDTIEHSEYAEIGIKSD